MKIANTTLRQKQLSLKTLAVALVLAIVWLGSALVLPGGGATTPIHAQGATRYVSAVSGQDTGPCTTPTAPCQTIQYAVGQAAAGDEIRIATYEVTLSGFSVITTTARYTGTASSIITLNKALHLHGGYIYGRTTGVWVPGLLPAEVNGEGARRPLSIISINGVTATLELLAFVNGHATRGGNVYVENAVVTFRATPLLSGTATYGGGLYCKNCRTTFDPGNLGAGDWLNLGLLPVRDNRATYGGGLYVEGGTPLLSGLYVYSNTATQDGGGLYLASGQPLIGGGLIAENHAGQRGGGLFLGNSPARLAGLLVYSNTAATGAGLYLDGPFLFSADTFPVIANTTVRYNAATGQGGGIYFHQALAGLVNNIIADNQAQQGAGLYLWAASPQVFHNTLAQNRGASGIHLTHKPGQLWPPVVPIPSRPTFTNTLIVSHTVGVMVESTSLPTPLQNQATLQGTLWYGNASDTGGAGAVVRQHDLTGDPRFTCTGLWPACLNPYHLLTDSAALEVGVPVALTLPGTDLFVDIDLQPRPSGAGYDLGADEVLSYTYSAWLIPPLSAQAVQPGETATYTHWLLNSGLQTDTYTLTCHSSQGWATLLAESPLTLGPQTRTMVQLRVEVPAEATAGLSDTTRLTATSAQVQAHALDLTAVLTGALADLAVHKQANVDRVTPGEAVRFTLTVSRTGALTGTLHLSDTVVPTAALAAWSLPAACEGDLNTRRVSCAWTLPQAEAFSASVEVIITTTAAYTGWLVNGAWVNAGPLALETDYGNNAAQVTVAINPGQRLFLPLVLRQAP